MYKLSIDLDRKLEIMSKHGLTAEEWLFIELLWTANDGQPEYLVKYFNECSKTGIPRDTIQALKDKKIFSASYKVPTEGEDFDYTEVEFSKTFINNYFKGSFEAGRELYQAYPPFIQNSEKLLCANNFTSKGYNDENDFFLKYNKAIQYKVENHIKVLEMLEWAKENKLINYGIIEYVTTRKWVEHEMMRESGEIGKISFKVDTLEDISLD